jgi:hypothetical protein
MTFRKITAIEVRMIKTKLSMKNFVSKSIPIEMKNIAMKLSLKGITSAVTWCAYSDSEIKSPAMKAPRAREKPISEIKRATLKHRNKTETMNKSLILDLTI